MYIQIILIPVFSRNNITFTIPTAALLPFIRLNSFTSSRSTLFSMHTGRLHVHSCVIVFSSGTFCGRLTWVAYARAAQSAETPTGPGRGKRRIRIQQQTAKKGDMMWFTERRKTPQMYTRFGIEIPKSPEFHIGGLTRVTSKGYSDFTWTIFNFEIPILVSE